MALSIHPTFTDPIFIRDDDRNEHHSRIFFSILYQIIRKCYISHKNDTCRLAESDAL